MTTWLKLTENQRKATIDQAAQISGIPPKAIEKDWWVTLSLKALFRSTYAKYMLFKGGTSLSKCWKLIARFSEDIDIALDPQAFGMNYVENPSKTYVERLKRRGCVFSCTELKADLERQFAELGVSLGLISVRAADIPEKRPDTDPQILLVKYPSLYEPSDYLADEVKIEIGVRSLKAPYTHAKIQSLLHEINPNPIYAETLFPVTVVEPRKTFLEKTMLLHEQFCKPKSENIQIERMSRHLYDLANLMNTSFGKDALSDHDLYRHLVQHRQWYSRISLVDYRSLGHLTLAFIPPPPVMEMYRQDYQSMTEKMIYEEAIPFDELISQLKMLQGKFRIKMQPITLEEIIAAAEAKLRQAGEAVEGLPITVPVSYTSDSHLPAEAGEGAVTYLVTLVSGNGKLTFESITIGDSK